MEILSTLKKDCIKSITNLKRLQLTLLTLALIVISIGASGQTKNSDPNVVTINYSNEINGYSVRIFWKPIEVRNTHTKGPAILEFYNNNDSTSFFLTNNHFGIENRKLPGGRVGGGDEALWVKFAAIFPPKLRRSPHDVRQVNDARPTGYPRPVWKSV